MLYVTGVLKTGIVCMGVYSLRAYYKQILIDKEDFTISKMFLTI